MRWLKTLCVGLMASVVVACGGGGGGSSLYSSSTGGTDSTTPAAASVEVLSSSTSVGTSGDTVTITAVVKSSTNVGLASAPVVFATTSGTLSNASATTSSAGVATATFSAGADKSNRSATIRVTSGSVSGQLVLPIAGSKLLISGSTTIPFGTSSTLTVKATDSSGNPIQGINVTFASALGNGLSATAATTDSSGAVSITYTATTSGSDTLTVSGGGSTATASINISGEDFVFITPTSAVQIPVGSAQTVQVRYQQNGVGVAGQTVNFASTGGAFAANGSTLPCVTPSASCAMTNASGVATVSISSSSAAAATLQASLAGTTAQTTQSVSFVATVPSRLVLQVSPSAIGVNASGSSANQAQVVAKVLDANSNPVPGLSVNFSRDADPSGGNVQQPSAITDLNGQASVQYIAGPQSTASNGVVLRATVASATSVTGTATLTVNQQALFLALGTGNTITNLDEQTYQKDWTVYVTDANGVAVPNVSLTVKVLPSEYRKGSMAWSPAVSAWITDAWDGVTLTVGGDLPGGAYISCGNEDATYGDSDGRSYNGILDSGEDFNGDGFLQPGNVISVADGSLTTDSTGRATITLQYAESYVPWVRVRLQVQAIVSGTAGTQASTFVVPGLSADFTDQNVAPAGAVSPFGVAPSCNSPN